MFTLQPTTFTQIWCGNYAAANAQVDELIALADEKGAVIWKMLGTVIRGARLALTGKTSEAVQVISCWNNRHIGQRAQTYG